MQSNFRNKQSSQWPLKKAITSGYHDSLRTLNFFPAFCCFAIFLASELFLLASWCQNHYNPLGLKSYLNKMCTSISIFFSAISIPLYTTYTYNVAKKCTTSPILSISDGRRKRPTRRFLEISKVGQTHSVNQHLVTNDLQFMWVQSFSLVVWALSIFRLFILLLLFCLI